MKKGQKFNKFIGIDVSKDKLDIYYSWNYKNEQIKNKLATAACKAAVKGGQNLSENEIQVLLKDITKPGRILQCPHGRPVCIKLTRYEIEKMFKRIVS